MKALIKTVELSKHYKKAIALNNVSVTIPKVPFTAWSVTTVPEKPP